MIKGALPGYQRYEGHGIRAKNVIEYNGRILYILSIKGSVWAPYPFLEELLKLDNFSMLLARDDTAEAEDNPLGELWLFEIDALKDMVRNEANEMTLKLVQGRNIGGDYYSFPSTLLKEKGIEGVPFNGAEDLKAKLRDKLDAPGW